MLRSRSAKHLPGIYKGISMTAKTETTPITPASILGKLRRVRELAGQHGVGELFEEEIVWIIDYIKAKEGKYR